MACCKRLSRVALVGELSVENSAQGANYKAPKRAFSLRAILLTLISPLSYAYDNSAVEYFAHVIGGFDQEILLTVGLGDN